MRELRHICAGFSQMGQLQVFRGPGLRYRFHEAWF